MLSIMFRITHIWTYLVFCKVQRCSSFGRVLRMRYICNYVLLNKKSFGLQRFWPNGFQSDSGYVLADGQRRCSLCSAKGGARPRAVLTISRIQNALLDLLRLTALTSAVSLLLLRVTPSFQFNQVLPCHPSSDMSSFGEVARHSRL